MSLLDDLKTVRDRIEHGWTQERYYRSTSGCFCLVGAAFSIQGMLFDNQMVNTMVTREIHAVFQALDAELPSDFTTRLNYAEARLVEWNDHPKRTKEEVLALVDKAIESAQS